MPPSDLVVKVLRELANTEETYVENIGNFLTSFVPVLKQNKTLVNDSMVQILISNAEQVHTLNSMFLKELLPVVKAGESCEEKELADSLANLFMNYAPLFKLYAQYAKNHENASTALQKVRRTDQNFNQSLLEVECQPETRGNNLWSFLIMPIQRVPRYTLLLREISKQIGDLDSKKKLSEAIEKVDEVGAHLNEAIRKRENAEKIAQIQDQLDQNIDLIKPGRIFVKEGNLLRLTHKGNLEEHIFHLFNDLLICSKETIQGLQLKEQITLLKISISVFEGKETIGNTKIDKSCAFQLSSSSSSFVVVAKSTAERDEWMESIKEASSVENFYQKKNESTSKSLLKTVDIPENLRLSYSAPVWVPDTEVQTCALCDNEFGVLRRRHHCRNCGRIVCDPCSPYKRVLANIGNDAVRVCQSCQDNLKKAYKENASKGQMIVKGKQKIKKDATFSEENANTDNSKQLKGVFKSNTFKDDSSKPDALAEMKDDRFRLAFSILEAEKTYVSKLKTFIDDFISPLMQFQASLKKKVSLISAVRVCFECIEQFLTIHTKFMQDLNQKLDLWQNDQKLGDVFFSLASLFKIYANYAANIEEALVSLRSPAMLDFTKAAFKDSQTNSKKMLDFLNLPMERILLCARDWKNLIASTSEQHKDFKPLNDALANLKTAADHINEAIKSRENRSKLVQIEEEFVNRLELVHPKRFYLKEGPVSILGKKGQVSKRFLYLFNDIFLIAEKTNIGFLLKARFEISNFIRVELVSPDIISGLNNAFSLRGKSQSILLEAENSFSKDEWFKAFDNAFAETRSSPNSVAPIWVPDTSSDKCNICEKAFSFWNRRHHCRMCGNLICNACSPFRKVLQNQTSAAVRVCSVCNPPPDSENQEKSKFQQVTSQESVEPDNLQSESSPGVLKAEEICEVADFEDNTILPADIEQDEKMKTMTLTRKKLQKFITTDGAEYYYDATADKSAWDVESFIPTNSQT